MYTIGGLLIYSIHHEGVHTGVVNSMVKVIHLNYGLGRVGLLPVLLMFRYKFKMELFNIPLDERAVFKKLAADALGLSDIGKGVVPFKRDQGS